MTKPKTKFRILQEADVPVDKLSPDPENANLHDEENLAAITASIKQFGQVERLVVRKSTRRVYAGNGRLDVLMRLGIPLARVQYVEGTDAECRAYAIAANQTARMSRFDLDVLVPQLESLQEEGLLEAAAYQAEDLEALLEDLKPSKPASKEPGGKASLTVECPQCHLQFKVGE